MSHGGTSPLRRAAAAGRKLRSPALGALLACTVLAAGALAQGAAAQDQRQGAEPPRPLGTLSVPREGAPASAPADGGLPPAAHMGTTGPSPADNLQLPGKVERSTVVVREAGTSCVADLVCLGTEARDNYITLVAEQTEPLTTTVFVDIAAGDVPNAPERVQARLDGEGRHVLARLGPIPPEYRLATSVRARLGGVGAVPDGTVYWLPFAPGSPRQVVWTGTPDNAAQRSYVQWAAEPGTPVLAARAGVVGAVRTQTEQAGLTDFPTGLGNMVAVAHDDGTVGIYGRLDFRGVQVRVGQRVQPGDPIGTTGLTGMGPDPAVAFTVVTPVGSGSDVRVWPVQFQTVQGLQSPATGTGMARQ